VLSLVREGLSNPQIGERLSISADAAKYHVSEILSKLGVSSREEAAAWRPEPSEEAARRPVWARAFQVMAFAAAAVALAGLGLLAWGVLRSSGEDGDGSVEDRCTRTETPAAPTIPTPTCAPRPTAVPFAIGEPVDMPENIAFVVETGCWFCEGPAESFVRVYRDSAGEYVSEKLVDAEQLGGSSIENSLIDLLTGRMFLVVCMEGNCGGPAFAHQGAREEAFESVDGGITWKDKGEFPLDHFPVAFSDNSVIVQGITKAPSAEEPNTFHYAYEIYPGGEVVTPPNGDDTAQVHSTDLAEFIWSTTDGRLLQADGSLIVRLPRDRDDGQVAVLSVRGGLHAGLVVVWVEEALQDAPHRATVLESSAEEGPTYSIGDETSDVAYQTVVELSKDGARIANGYGADGRQLPAVVDALTGVVHPIEHPFADTDFPFTNQRNLVVAVERGPFARVRGTGSCLNVRHLPSAASEVRECVADNVLLSDNGHVKSAEGVVWRFVSTPAGNSGWASMEFLEVDPSRPVLDES
jgi:hypothetical protein